jgi:hypothetical protein
MNEKSFPVPNATAYTIERLVGEVRRGRVRIPAFQRKLRWQWENVRRLFDSIDRGYPIGSLLLWSKPARSEALRIGHLKINAPETSAALWVVDGQQRLTSLACALTEPSDGTQDERFGLAYDPKGKQFMRPKPGETDWIPLPVVFDSQRLLRWFAAHPEATDHLDEALRVNKAIREFSVPLYIVEHEDEAVLRDIFDRMNNYGKRLTRAEVFSALNSGGSSSPPASLSDIAEQLDSNLGFGVIDDDTILRSVLARRGADVAREIRLEFESGVSRDFAGETREQAYLGAAHALELTIHFLRQDAGVPHFSFLPYRHLLVVLARFFAHYPNPAERNRVLLRRWFWRAALAGPNIARGAWTGAMRLLASQVSGPPEGSESNSVQDLLRKTPIVEVPPNAASRFHSKAAESRLLLCVLWSLQPRSLVSAHPYDLSDLTATLGDETTPTEALALFFRRATGAGKRAGNRFILLRDDTPDDATILFARPIGRSQDEWLTFLQSHALTPELFQLLEDGKAAQFLDQRDAIIESHARAFVSRMAEPEHEGTRPLCELDLDNAEEPEEDEVDDDEA